MQSDHTGAGERFTRPRDLFLHFGGAAVTKLAPPLVQLVLLLLVARNGTLDDVGRLVGSALTWSLVALTAGRVGGTMARAAFVRNLPQSTEAAVAPLLRAQLPFALAALAIVFQGQADMLAIGFFGTLGLAAVYGPLLRTAYSTLLSAEAFSWGLYGDAHPEEHAPGGLFARHWRAASMALGVVLAIAFAFLAEPFLRFLLHRSLPSLTLAIALFAVVIVLRFAALVLNVEILRAGRQRDEIPVLAVASVVLAVGAVVAARHASIAGLAGARLASEGITAAGYFALARRAPARRRIVSAPTRAPGRRLRLLVMTPFPPSLDGAHGGSRVISQFLAHMAERHDVALVCLRHPRDPEVDPVLRSRLTLVEEVDRPDWSATRLRRLAGGLRTRLRLFAGTPLWASEVDVAAYRERLRAVLAQWRPDIAQIEYTVMGTYLRELEAAGVPIVLVEPDPASHAALDLQRVSRG